MRRFIHIVVLLALYNICGFCLKFSLLFPAVVAGVFFFITAWIGMFISLTRMIIMLLEGKNKSKT